MKKNLVSVVMSQYNTEEQYLRNAIDSVLNQTYKNFELIIVDDGSTDNSVNVIRSYSDKRIILLEKEHSGITKSLNVGLNVAQGEFLARMDSDDVCMPNRFEIQVKYLREHPKCIVCGSYAEFIGYKYEKTSNGKYTFDIPEKDVFHIRLLFSNFPTILHSSAMFNYKMLKEYGIIYDEKYCYSQDYKMWIDCNKVAECANSPNVLMQIRRHDGSVSHKYKAVCDACTKEIINEQLQPLGLSLPENWKKIHWGCLNHARTPESEEWVEKILEQNRIYKIYDQTLMESIVFGERVQCQKNIKY